MSRTIDGAGGERSLLAAALEEGQVALARSHRLHRPRGGFCARGWCHQCPVAAGAVEGLACELPAGHVPRQRVDPLRLLGAVGERMPPWFYERRFRMPRALRQVYLRRLRSLSAAPTLPGAPAAAPPASAPDVTTDVLVVGGGPAGLAAAAAVAETGAGVAVITLGELAGTARSVTPSERDLRTLADHGARSLTSTLCLGLYEEEQAAAAFGPTGPFTVGFERLVVATGAYDRLPLVPGNDLPGIVGVRAFERLAAQREFGRGLRAGVTGHAPEVARARLAAERFGIELAWWAELDGDERLVRIDGRRRVRAAAFASGARHPCDVLVVGLTQPTFELQLLAGRTAVAEGSPPVVRTRGAARMPLLVVGEAAGHVDPVKAVASTRVAASSWLENEAGPAGESLAPATPPDPDAFVCLCEDVRVRDVAEAAADGFDDLELVKRRTGATTGPCQGKLCLPLLCEVAAWVGLHRTVPAARPPVRPVRIASLGGAR